MFASRVPIRTSIENSPKFFPVYMTVNSSLFDNFDVRLDVIESLFL